MLKRKMGFTLIELLAVIVILSIIMMIVTPIIVKTINDAKKGAFKNSAYGMIKAAEFEYAKKVLEDNGTETVTYTYTGGTETSNPTGYVLDYKGAKPTSGKLIVTAQGKISLMLHNGTYCAEKGVDTDTVTITDKNASTCTISP